MKRILTLLLLSFTLISVAQENAVQSVNSIPAGYYNTATGTGYTLKTQLFNIIKNHNDRGYSGLWTTYETADRDHQYENDGTLIDLYSENPTGADPYNFTVPDNQCGTYSAEGGCYNREHVIPQSYFGNGVQPMYSDAHSVIPTDGKVNGWRDDHPYGIVAATANPCNAGATNTPCSTLNGSRLGNNVNSDYSFGYTGKVFEPLDAFKGDIARIIFYFATRYEDRLVDFYTTSASEAKIIFDGTTGHTFNQTFLNILLTWNSQDPVSPREIERNDAIYARQNNRNPFIDHPEYAAAIWGTPLAVPTFDSLSSVSIYPNPSSDIVNISTEIALDEIEIITINGQVLQQLKNPASENNTYVISNLPKGFYFVKLSSASNSVTKKVLIN